MAIQKTTLQKYSETFLLCDGVQQLADAVESFNQLHKPANQVYLLVKVSNNEYLVSMFCDLQDLIETSLSQPLKTLAIPEADDIELTNTSRSWSDIQEWLSTNPGSTLVVTEGDTAIGLLTNPNRSGTPRRSKKNSLKDVRFTAYYPSEIPKDTRHSLSVYTYLRQALADVENNIKKFVEEFGGNSPSSQTTAKPLTLTERTLITVTPECAGVDFNPTSLMKTWNEPWTCFNFDFKMHIADPSGKNIGRISIAMGGIEIANIPLEFHVTQVNPLILAETLIGKTARSYDKIFVSYSRKDKAIVENYRLAQLAIGNDVFMDTYSIRPGENWRVALANAIREADIFQLFWSTNSAASENVQYEWDYALQQKCSDTGCVDFIRPVCWEIPAPNPPEKLKHLNFRYVPLAK